MFLNWFEVQRETDCDLLHWDGQGRKSVKTRNRENHFKNQFLIVNEEKI